MSKPVFDFSQMDFSRVAIIGSAGSGKTTLAKQLGTLFDRPVTHLDKILWGENWTELTHEQRLQILQPIVDLSQWIIDGTWAKTLEYRYKRATLVIFLDYKPTFCAWRAFRRSLKHKGIQRDDLAEGCIEKINFGFYRYILNFRKNTLPRIKNMQQTYPDVPVLCLKTTKQTKAFLSALQSFLTK